MHEDIKRFEWNGEVGDSSSVLKIKDTMIHEMENQMRDQGFVPVLDMDPQYTHQYDVVNDKYLFVLSIYGTEVGEEAWNIAGMMGGKPIMKYTHPAK